MPRLIHRCRNPLGSAAVIISLVMVALAASGCQSDELSESEQKLVRDIFRSGLEMEPDPFVRAETLRALQFTADARLAVHAEPLTRDDHPMVRVAAIQTLIAADHPDVHNRAVHLFNRGEEEEQFHILDVGLEKGDEELRKALVESAHNTTDTRLRTHALKKGLIRDIEDADDGDRDDLLSELGRYVLDDDPEVAGLALQVLVEAGQTGRADRFLEQFGEDAGSTQERIHAAQVLAMGRVDSAREHFEEILAEAEADDPEDLGVAQKPHEEELLRWAVLGLAALGDEDFVPPAQRYLRDAESTKIIEVLDILSTNPSPDATLSLRNRLRDRPPVGRHALKLYAPRDDARITSLIQATSHRDYQTRRLAASLLVQYFSGPWVIHLEEKLSYSDPAAVKRTLRILQTLLDGEEQLQIVEAIKEPLQELASGDGQKFVHEDADDDDLVAATRIISTLAADLLFRLTGDATYAEIIAAYPDRQTLYAHLEHLAIQGSEQHAGILRRYLRDDSYPLRLMAAAGLWNALGDDVDLQLLGWVAEEEE